MQAAVHSIVEAVRSIARVQGIIVARYPASTVTPLEAVSMTEGQRCMSMAQTAKLSVAWQRRDNISLTNEMHPCDIRIT